MSLLDKLGRWAEARRIRNGPRIGSMATMPSRAESFARVLPVVAPQVDRLYLYLDGFPRVPDLVRAYPNVVPLLAHEHGDLHAAGRFLPLTWLRKRCVFVIFDDDIVYPPTYAAAIVEGLAACAGRAVVAYHGNVFRRPYQSYVKDRHCYHFAAALERQVPVHAVGSGTAAFDSGRLSFDPAAWPRAQCDDLLLGIEAARRGLPLFVLPHAKGWLAPIGGVQPDSIYAARLADDRDASALMRTLVAMRAGERDEPAAALGAAMASAPIR
jgi:hypothetical protein